MKNLNVKINTQPQVTIDQDPDAIKTNCVFTIS